MPTLSRFILALSPVLLAALPTALHAHPDHEPEPASQCVLPPGWSAIAARDPQFVVLGELHGTKEAPAFVSDLVCALAARGDKVLLAVEHGSTYDARWQEAWALPQEQFRNAVLQHGWQGREDGVASIAMLDMIVRAHALKEGGAHIGIVAFNGARDDDQRTRFADLPSQGPHEAAQAENIAEAAAAGNYDTVIVLVGSLHAMKAPTSIGGPEFDPMAARLASYGPVATLVMEHGGGSSWSCQLSEDAEFVPSQPLPQNAVVCADHLAGGRDDLEGEPFVSLTMPQDDPKRGFYDGFFWLGPITASPPAFPAEE